MRGRRLLREQAQGKSWKAHLAPAEAAVGGFLLRMYTRQVEPELFDPVP